MQERDIEEIYERIKEIEDTKEKDTLTKVPPNVKVWLSLVGGAIVLGVVMKWISLMVGIMTTVGVLVALKFIYGDITSGRELNEQELAGMLYSKLRYKQLHKLGGYFQVDPWIIIKVERIGRRILVNGVPSERVFGVSFYDPREHRTTWYRYSVDLYSGDILGPKKLPAGFIDIEAWDVRTIESEELKMLKRYRRAMGIKGKTGPGTQDIG